MLKDRVKSILSFGVMTNILGILQSILLARLLGPELRGELAVPLTFVLLVLPLSSMGFKQNLSFLIRRRGIYVSNRSLAFLSLICMMSSAAFTSVYIYFYPDSIDFVLIQVFALILIRTLADLFSYKLLVLQQAHKITQLSFIRASIEVLLIVFLFMSQVKSLDLVLNVFIVSYSCYCLLILYKTIYSNQVDNLSDKKTLLFDGAFFKRGLAYGAPLFLININISFDILMLGKLSTSKSVGLYQVAVSIANILWVIPTLLWAFIFSESLHKELPELLSKLLKFFQFLLKASVLLLVPVTLSHWFFPLVYGDSFEKSAQLFNILILGYYAMLTYKVSYGVFASHGLVRIPLIIFSVCALLNICLNYFLIPRLSEEGAAIATLTSYLICGALFYFYTYRLKRLYV